MIIFVDSTGASIRELDDLTSLKAVSGCDRVTTASLVRRAGAGRLVDGHVEVRPEFVTNAAARNGLGPDWEQKFYEMVEYATSHGWVTPDGALLAHLEWEGPSPAVDGRAFRDTLGHYASGITVISTLDDGEPVGFTCQSFYSVSVDPPLISFSVMTTSTTYPRVRKSGTFAVNVLAHHQHSVSSQFARSGTDKWAGIDWTPSPLGNPLITDTLMWLDCEIAAEYPAGDHFIVVGEVLAMSPADWHKHEPLLFFKGGYRHLEPASE